MIQKRINILLFIIGMLFLNLNNIYAQGAIDIQLSATDGAATNSQLRVGLDLTATNGIDPSLGESDLPPFPPAGVFEVRFDLTPYAGSALSSYQDYRNVPSFPFTGTTVHRLIWQDGTGASFTLNYNFPTGVTATFVDEVTGGILFTANLSGTGSYLVPNNSLTAGILTVSYNNVAPVVAGPIFSASPISPLTIAPTAVGGSNTGNVTVSNTGTAALNITGITSSDAQFSISPSTATIAAGGNQVFVVTFSPTALGNFSSNLSFTHNAPGSPSAYIVNGVGASAGPTFAVNPTSLSFGTLNQGTSANLTVTVSNNGLTNPLSITSVTTSAPYTVSPLTANIPAGGNQVFTVTFAPTTGGSFPGTLSFTHNAPGSPSNVTLSGSATSVFGLVFSDTARVVKEDSTYSDIIQLKSLSAVTQAIQFRLLVNKSADDDAIVTFQSLEKGTDVASADWNLQYEVFRGPLTSNGASVDSIYVLLYNLQQNTGLSLGDHNNLLKVNYRIADLPALQDSSKSSFLIVEEQGSTFQGFPVSILGSRDEFKVKATNRVSSLGDVNGDGSIDILDLINVVDHIVGRDSLDAAEFIRADIAPWSIGLIAPTPDNLVNVQDLAVIQNIILTGLYPSGTVVNRPSFLAGNEEGSLNKVNGAATVKLHITKEGIAVRLNSEVGIRGAQIEFGSVEDNTSNMIIDSRLGGGFYNQINELLRVLLYDPSGNAVVNAGENFVANIPFALENPQDISVDKIVLVDIMNKKVGEINVEIFYENAPEMPIDYSLSQNYPNPFNPITSVRFSVPKDGLVTLKVYDMIGQEVATLFSGNAQRGTYTLNWNGKDNSGKYVSSGSYVYRMSANSGEFVQTKKMMFLK